MEKYFPGVELVLFPGVEVYESHHTNKVPEFQVTRGAHVLFNKCNVGSRAGPFWGPEFTELLFLDYSF